jgi:hypothetical protein
VIRRTKTEPVRVTDEADLGIDWERWADGRVWRLKRKRHFADVDPSFVGKMAEPAAKRMGKAVMTAKDRYDPHKYIWVQFANHKVGPGESCPCGSRRLLRVHTNFARCPDCHAQLLLSDVVDDDEERETRAARILRELTDVHLERRGRSDTRELYRGYGRQEGTPAFLLVEFHIKPAEKVVKQDDVFDRVSTVRLVPFPELADLFDVPSLEISSLWGGREPNWDFVW